jgi:AcrR family transcriptional regulator
VPGPDDTRAAPAAGPAPAAAPALSPRAREIVATGRALLEAEGPAGLSMRRIADALGIRAPSLYKHLPDKAALEAALIADGFAELAERFEADNADPYALGRTYRAFGREHPHLYRLMTAGRLPRERLPAGLEDRAAQPVVLAAQGDPDKARALFAFAHGMTILELDGRFPDDADIDAAWRAGIARFAGPF